MAKKRGNGEGTIVKRADGRWMAVITIGRAPVTGKLKRATFYGKTRQEAAAHLADALWDKAHGVFVAPHQTTVGEWLAIWLTTYKQPAVRPLTFQSYAQQIRLHITPALGHLALKDLRPEQVQHFYNSYLVKGLSPRLAKYWHVILHNALRHAEKNGLVVRNVTTLCTPPRQSRTARSVLTVHQIAQTLFPAITEDRLGAAIIVACGTGLRRGEVLGLRWQDVDMLPAVVHVRQTVVRITAPSRDGAKTQLIFQDPKTAQSRRTVPLPAFCLLALRQHRAGKPKTSCALGTRIRITD
jgi:integrase